MLNHMVGRGVRAAGMFAVGVLTLLFAACSGGTDCPDGLQMGPDGACHTVCQGNNDCTDCQECRDGLCFDLANCADGSVDGGADGGGDSTGDGGTDGSDVGADDFDPCDLCDPVDEICVGGQCLPACDDDQDCQQGYECYLPGGYCIESSVLKAYGGVFGCGVFESMSTSYTLRGTPLPWGQVSQGGGYKLVPPVN